MSEDTQADARQNQQPKEKSDEELAAEFRNDLDTNERYKPFFEQYNSSGREHFTRYYSEYKVRLLKAGKKSLENEENELISISRRGAACLWQIQQRKLFDLQCQWRAGLINLPDVHTTWDFRYWGAIIERCPYLPPITRDEYDFYREYMNSEDFDEYQHLHSFWQDYDLLKIWREEEDEDEDTSYPPWYTFHEEHKGGRDWLLLPDIRGEKEEKYWKMTHPSVSKTAGETPADTRPYIRAFDFETREDFIKSFERPEILRYFYAYEKDADWEDDEERLRFAIWGLLALDEPMPIEYNDDWREGIYRAAERATQLRLVNAYDAAYKEYLSREELGLKHEINLDEKEIEKEDKHRTWYTEEIKKARLLNGEKAEPDY